MCLLVIKTNMKIEISFGWGILILFLSSVAILLISKTMKERGKTNQFFQVIRGKVFFRGFLGSSVVKNPPAMQ